MFVGCSDSRSVPMMLNDLYTAFTSSNGGKSVEEMKRLLHIMSIEEVVLCSQLSSSAGNNAV